MLETTLPAATDARVLVCAIDRGLFGIQAGWVEAVYPTASTTVHTTRTGGGARQPFIVHRDEPALIVDLRQALALDGVLGAATRDAFLVVRSATALLAIPVDHCVGIRTLDLGEQLPVPSAVERDGGLPMAHLLELDGRMLAVLDPARILEPAHRDAILSAQRRARAICQRQHKLAALWQEIRRAPTPAALRAYASLCARSGRRRAAAGARAVLAALPDGDEAAASDRQALLSTLLRCAAEQRSGTLRCRAGELDAAIEIAAGRPVASRAGNENGRGALALLLGSSCEAITFTAGAVAPGRGEVDSAAAAVIAAFESTATPRRARITH